MENYIFWSVIGSGFGESGGTPPPRIPRSNPPGVAKYRLFSPATGFKVNGKDDRTIPTVNLSCYSWLQKREITYYAKRPSSCNDRKECVTSLQASSPFMMSEASRERTPARAAKHSHSRLLSRAALARLLATPTNGELARRLVGDEPIKLYEATLGKRQTRI